MYVSLETGLSADKTSLQHQYILVVLVLSITDNYNILLPASTGYALCSKSTNATSKVRGWGWTCQARRGSTLVGGET